MNDNKKPQEASSDLPNTIIELDKKKILEEISSKGKYEENNILIKRWEENSDNYIIESKKNGTHFMGILNGLLERNGYGINIYKTGEKYLGYFEQDLPNKNGIYIWSPLIKGRNIHFECYQGFWKNNKKDKNGTYIWLTEPLNNKEFDNADFDAYVGNFDKDKFIRGTYLSKIKDDYYLYHGSFDNEGKKSDENAFFYSSKYDRILKGKIEKDVFVNAFVAFFESDSGEIKNLVKCTFDKKGNIENIVLMNDLNKEEKEKEEKEITLFRNVILEIDYFGIIYERFHKVKDFIRDNCESIDIFEDKNKFPSLMTLCRNQGENNIFKNIEKQEKKKKI